MKILGNHTLIIIIGVLLAAGAAWYALSSSSAPPPDITTTADATTSDDQFLQTLQVLQSTKLDTSIFTNPVFLSLTDFSTQIIPEPVGRTDPFAPLSASAAATPASTESAGVFNSQQ